MKILVTGATGFIGNYVIENLLKRNLHVIASSTNIESAKNKSWFDKVTFLPYRIGEKKENLYSFFGQPDVLIHLAWEGLPNYKELFHLEKVLFSQYQFLKQMVEEGLKDITVSGTFFEYGMIEGCMKEEMRVEPTHCYAIAKDCLRRFLEQLNLKYEFSFKWLRLFHMYGEGQFSKSIIPQLNAALKNGEKEFKMSKGDQIRDYLPVEETADIIVRAALQKKVTGIINCCSGKPIELKEFVLNYLKEINKSIPLNLGYYPYSDVEPFSFWGDTTKLDSLK